MKVTTNMRYDWDQFPIGATRAYPHCYRQAVISSFQSFCNRRKLDWEISTRSDPPSPKRGMRCNMVWATRIDPRKPKEGMSEGEIDETGSAISKLAGVRPPDKLDGVRFHHLSRPIILDIRDIPVKTREELYEVLRYHTRLTKRGWDRFAVHDYEITNVRISDVRKQINRACLARNLMWRWEFRRIQNPNDSADRTIWYLVSRLR